MADYLLSIDNVDGIERLSWVREIPGPFVYRCWRERDLWQGTFTTCDYVRDPSTFQVVYHPPGWLPDSDGILLRIREGTPGAVEFVLSVDHNITWWKALSVGGSGPLADNTQFAELYGDGNLNPLEPDDQQQTGRMRVETAAIRAITAGGGWRAGGPFGQIGLYKAKFFGVHREVYGIDLSTLERFDGKCIQFHWRGD